MGTQRLEEEVQRLFPQARILRMDADVSRKKGAHEKVLSAFERQEADILVGTQMVAKGLDFPLVTLVAVLNADAGLNASDFRAGERTFQLLVQVLGRAGRKDKAGTALIQTYKPQNQILNYASMYNYEAFINEELMFRKKLKYPPFRFISYFIYG